jgi:hypothetical protein
MIPQRIRRAVLERQGGRCAACGADLYALARAKALHKYLPPGRTAVEIDHMDPRAEGGLDDLANLQALCGHCHHQKTEGERPHWDAPSPSPFASQLRARESVPRAASKALRLRAKAPLKHYGGSV